MGEHAGRATIGELRVHPVPAFRVVVSPAYLFLCDAWWQWCVRFDLRSAGWGGFPSFGLTMRQPYQATTSIFSEKTETGTEFWSEDLFSTLLCQRPDSMDRDIGRWPYRAF
jgi:hypothetical protein